MNGWVKTFKTRERTVISYRCNKDDTKIKTLSMTLLKMMIFFVMTESLPFSHMMRDSLQEM